MDRSRIATQLMHTEKKEGKIAWLRGFPVGESEMCDYSLHSIKSRPAKVGDKLTMRYFGTGTKGFAASEDANVVVCVRPGTELSFALEVTCQPIGIFGLRDKVIRHKTAIFRQIHKDKGRDSS